MAGIMQLIGMNSRNGMSILALDQCMMSPSHATHVCWTPGRSVVHHMLDLIHLQLCYHYVWSCDDMSCSMLQCEQEALQALDKLLNGCLQHKKDMMERSVMDEGEGGEQ